MSTEPSGRNWAFDGFKVMTEMRLLISGDAPVPLTSKAFDTLVVLIENRDRVVTKDELLSSVWPNVEVEEGNLTQQIFLLRKALGETAQQPHYIVTIPGHGYRFTARVNAIAEDPAAPAVSSNSAPTSPAARGSVFVATGLTVFGVIALAIVIGSRWLPMNRPHVPADFTRHIAKITESGKATSSAISRDGRYVAYVESDGDQYSLWLKQVGTDSNIPVVPNQPLQMKAAGFSPDGGHIYFVRQGSRGQFAVLYRIPTLGGLETPVLEDVDSAISFSPDGRKFVFQRGPTAGAPTIVVAAADGSSQQILAKLELPLSLSLFAPDWSPDGKVVAAAVTDLDTRSRSIVLLSVDDGSRRELYRTDSHLGRLRWLPDGSGLLAVVGERLERRVFGRATGGAIWRIDYPSGRAERLTSDLANDDPCCLDIGANGSIVANVVNTLVSDLWIAPADRFDALKQVTSDLPVIMRHSWLPDNDTLVYRDVNGRLKTINKDRRGSSLPVPEGQDVQSVSACGDGRHVVFATVPGRNIWRVTPDAGNPRRLTSGFNDFNPACSPDGKWVFYVSRPPEAKFAWLWQVPIDGGTPTPLDVSGYDVLPSPTGRMIFYQTEWVEPGSDRNRPDRWEVISSTDRKRLLVIDAPTDLSIGVHTKWAPDESGLDYLVTRNGVSNIWRQPLTGGPPVQITHLSVGRIFTFAWSPDGQWLSLGIGADRSDVVLMSSEQ